MNLGMLIHACHCVIYNSQIIRDNLNYWHASSPGQNRIEDNQAKECDRAEEDIEDSRRVQEKTAHKKSILSQGGKPEAQAESWRANPQGNPVLPEHHPVTPAKSALCQADQGSLRGAERSKLSMDLGCTGCGPGRH